MQVMLVARPEGDDLHELSVHLREVELEPTGELLAGEARGLRKRLGDTVPATLEITVANDLGVRLDPREHPWLEAAIARACAVFQGEPDAERAEG